MSDESAAGNQVADQIEIRFSVEGNVVLLDQTGVIPRGDITPLAADTMAFALRAHEYKDEGVRITFDTIQGHPFVFCCRTEFVPTLIEQLFMIAKRAREEVGQYTLQ